MNEIALRIVKLLNENKMQKKELADKINVSSAAISNYLNKGQIPSAEIIGKMANALNTSTDFIIFGHEEYKELIEEQLLEAFRELNHENKVEVVGETTKLLIKQRLEKKD